MQRRGSFMKRSVWSLENESVQKSEDSQVCSRHTCGSLILLGSSRSESGNSAYAEHFSRMASSFAINSLIWPEVMLSA